MTCAEKRAKFGLKPFGITAPKDPLWRGAEHARGYRREDFEDAFLRYLC